MEELKCIKNRILLNFIAGPKIQVLGHFLTNQIHIITNLFWILKHLLITFWIEFSWMFLICDYSWLVIKYKIVTSMLMRFWSEISRMFTSMFLELIILRQKNVYSISYDNEGVHCIHQASLLMEPYQQMFSYHIQDLRWECFMHSVYSSAPANNRYFYH